jgi:magnesium-transporting ATPase (P-type)
MPNRTHSMCGRDLKRSQLNSFQSQPHFCSVSSSQKKAKGKKFMYVKGAPDVLLNKCSRFLADL